MAPLPPFQSDGDLPIGVHPGSLNDVLVRFGGGTPQRHVVGQRLERIRAIAVATGCLSRFIVFGSFITDEPYPNDVDIFMVMEDNFDVDNLVGDAELLFRDHLNADVQFGASVFWLRRMAAIDGEQAAVEFWQIKLEGGQRGIVEIVRT
ncbi:MAG TPA: hypothetical protein VMP01_05115 [Pirellulaceae bacterium]|nr:hypothetical protein [Pirellulaceae bacterium]